LHLRRAARQLMPGNDFMHSPRQDAAGNMPRGNAPSSKFVTNV